jgi:flagellar basal-body rod modification protein FlgD
VELPTGADKLTVTIKDNAGATIRSLTLGEQDAGVVPLSWDGKNDAGVQVADGNYKFEVSASTGANAVTANPLSYSQVLSISNNSTGIKLNLSNMDTVATSDVKEIF